MGKNLRETIKEIVRKHLKSKKGKVFGQCLTAVGWVGGTLPELYEKDGMVEVSMADVADGGFVVGAPTTNPPSATSAIDTSTIPSFSYNSGNVPPTHPTAVRH